jgi:hypothetical protein
VRWQGKKSVTVTKGEFFERVRKAHKLDRKPVHRKRYSNAFVRCRRTTRIRENKKHTYKRGHTLPRSLSDRGRVCPLTQ